MLLGKRPRPPIKRTTSITEFTVDLSYMEAPDMQNLVEPVAEADHHHHHLGPGSRRSNPVAANDIGVHHHNYHHHHHQEGFDRRLLATISPRNHRRQSADFLETAHFLRACGLCKRRLAPSRDIYMYRGDTAFCSLDCRQQQMNLDELKEKCSLASSNLEGPASSVESEASNNGTGTLTAA